MDLLKGKIAGISVSRIFPHSVKSLKIRGGSNCSYLLYSHDVWFALDLALSSFSRIAFFFQTIQAGDFPSLLATSFLENSSSINKVSTSFSSSLRLLSAYVSHGRVRRGMYN